MVMVSTSPWRLRVLFINRKSCGFIAGFSDVTLEDLTFVIDRTPEVHHLAVQLHVHFIKVPFPMAEAPHPAGPLLADIGSEQRTEPVPPQPHCLVTQIDPALEQQIFHVPQR